ncbi:hypothetical protein Q3G72_025310 [Acer saccharum]|nr:hypothetical protein Q3G72_025310 [Acer saccharum]
MDHPPVPKDAKLTLIIYITHFSLSAVSLLCNLPRFDNLIFMNLTTAGASAVSCKSGNKNHFFSWILFCLLPKFLGTPIAYVPFLLIKAIDRSPSSIVLCLENFGEI